MEQDQLSLRELEESVDFWVELKRNIRRGGVCKDLVTWKRMTHLMGHGWAFGLEKAHGVNKKVLGKGGVKTILGKADDFLA